MQGNRTAAEFSAFTGTASIVQDLADAGIRVKPGYVRKSSTLNVFSRSCLASNFVVNLRH